MNWTKILGNIAGVALGCVAVQQVTGSPDWKALGMGILMCAVSNQIGLHQKPPSGGRQ